MLRRTLDLTGQSRMSGQVRISHNKKIDGLYRSSSIIYDSENQEGYTGYVAQMGETINAYGNFDGETSW
jgi:hypothetical protein